MANQLKKTMMPVLDCWGTLGSNENEDVGYIAKGDEPEADIVHIRNRSKIHKNDIKYLVLI